MKFGLRFSMKASRPSLVIRAGETLRHQRVASGEITFTFRPDHFANNEFDRIDR